MKTTLILIFSLLVLQQKKVVEDKKLLIDGFNTRMVIVYAEYEKTDTLRTPHDEVITYSITVKGKKIPVAIKSNYSFQFLFPYYKIKEIKK